MRLRPETLKKYAKIARDILVNNAKKGDTITYGELIQEMGGPGRGYIGEVLEAVCRGEHKRARPMLGAVVIHKGDRVPGHAFWNLPWIPEDIRNAPKETKIDYWKCEREKVYHYWRNCNP
jgi:hypothetical protein